MEKSHTLHSVRWNTPKPALPPKTGQRFPAQRAALPTSAPALPCPWEHSFLLYMAAGCSSWKCEKAEKGVWVKERISFRKLPPIFRTTAYIMPLLTSATGLFRFSNNLKLVAYHLHFCHGFPNYNDSWGDCRIFDEGHTQKGRHYFCHPIAKYSQRAHFKFSAE